MATPCDELSTRTKGTSKKTTSESNNSNKKKLGTDSLSDGHSIHPKKGFGDLQPDLLRRLLMEMALSITVNREVDYDLTLAGLGLVCRRWFDVIQSPGFREQFIKSVLAADPSHLYRLKEDYLPTVLFKLSTGFPAPDGRTQNNRTEVWVMCVCEDELYVNFISERHQVFVYKTCDINVALDGVDAHRQTFAYTRSRFSSDSVIVQEECGEMLPTRVLSFDSDLPRLSRITSIKCVRRATTGRQLYLLAECWDNSYGRMRHAIRKVNAQTGQLFSTWNIDLGDDVPDDDRRLNCCLFSTIHVDRHSGDVAFTGRFFITWSLVCIVYNAVGQIIARYELVDNKHQFPSLLSFPADVGRRLAAENGQQHAQQHHLPPSAAAPAAAAAALESTHYLLVLATDIPYVKQAMSSIRLYRHFPNQVFPAFGPADSICETANTLCTQSDWYFADLDDNGLLVLSEQIRGSQSHRIRVFGSDLKHRREVGSFGSFGRQLTSGELYCFDHSNGVLYFYDQVLNNGLRCVDLRRRPRSAAAS